MAAGEPGADSSVDRSAPSSPPPPDGHISGPRERTGPAADLERLYATTRALPCAATPPKYSESVGAVSRAQLPGAHPTGTSGAIFRNHYFLISCWSGPRRGPVRSHPVLAANDEGRCNREIQDSSSRGCRGHHMVDLLLEGVVSVRKRNGPLPHRSRPRGVLV
jgi:hypothetical protein